MYRMFVIIIETLVKSYFIFKLRFESRLIIFIFQQKNNVLKLPVYNYLFFQ
jgi:hypothetical protein